MEKIRIQNDLFKLIGVKDGDPRYADCLLISNYVQQEIVKTRISEIERCEHLHGYSRQDEIAELSQTLKEKEE